MHCHTPVDMCLEVATYSNYLAWKPEKALSLVYGKYACISAPWARFLGIHADAETIEHKEQSILSQTLDASHHLYQPWRTSVENKIAHVDGCEQRRLTRQNVIKGRVIVGAPGGKGA
eukprot:1157874-Pelagomonas_calceolata.AAC.2